MPNIEILGYRIKDADSLRTIMELQGTIKNALEQLGMSEDAVMTLVDSDVYTCATPISRKPFLRVCSTNGEERLAIADMLHKVLPQMDIEILAIEKFIAGQP